MTVLHVKGLSHRALNPRFQEQACQQVEANAQENGNWESRKRFAVYGQEDKRRPQPRQNDKHTSRKGSKTMQCCLGNQDGIKDEITLNKHEEKRSCEIPEKDCFEPYTCEHYLPVPV